MELRGKCKADFEKKYEKYRVDNIHSSIKFDMFKGFFEDSGIYMRIWEGSNGVPSWYVTTTLDHFSIKTTRTIEEAEKKAINQAIMTYNGKF